MNKNLITIAGTFIYVIIFTIIALVNQDTSFMIYSLLYLAIIIFATKRNMYKNFPVMLGVGLSLMGLMHILGIYVYIGEVRLYEAHIVRIGYDNIMHFFYSALFLFTAYHFLKPHLNGSIKKNPLYLSSLLVLITLGVGAINEIIELVLVVGFGAHQLVGDYMNNAVDLIANLFGALFAMSVILIRKKKI